MQEWKKICNIKTKQNKIKWNKAATTTITTAQQQKMDWLLYNGCRAWCEVILGTVSLLIQIMSIIKQFAIDRRMDLIYWKENRWKINTIIPSICWTVKNILEYELTFDSVEFSSQT